jgi:hypothetical protein
MTWVEGPFRVTKLVELYTESVFFGRYRSVFLGIYHTDTKGKLGRYIRYQNFGGSLSKKWREPPFSYKGGPRPPFCTLRPPFEEKKEFLRNFSKKEFPQNLKKVFPPNLTVQQYWPKIPKVQQIWYQQNTDIEKTAGNTVVYNSRN